jgi:hypothetical protein
VGTTEDRDDPGLSNIGPDGMQETYLVLSEADRAMGFVRPLRRTYVHVGAPAPKYPLFDLTDEQRERYAGAGYEKYEAFPLDEDPRLGRFWTQAQLDKVGKGCGAATTMAQPIAETYARQPSFYGGTFCVGCGAHFPVGERGEFVWDDGERVGT